MTKLWRTGLVLGAGLFLQTQAAEAATITAASCALTAVQSAVNSAVDGDTVLVPAGTCSWGAALSITNKTITLQGAGALASGGTRINYSGTNHTLIAVDAGTKKGKMDISGFYLYGGDSNYWNGTAMQLWGSTGWKNLRVHHNVFDNNITWTIKGDSGTHGLIDHNTFKGQGFGIMLYGAGAADWAAPLVLGTADFFFVEDNDFQYNDFYGSTGVPVMDMDSGGRQVFRNNMVKHGMWETHDKARSGLVSANAYEIYNNTFDGGATNKWKAVDVSAGTGVIWGNKIIGTYAFPIGAIDYKSFDPRSVKLCNGSDPADQNVPGESGWRCQYQIGSMGEGPTAYGYPLYTWGNTINDSAIGMQCTDGCNHVQAGRDFINSASAKAGYAPYTYPHPLQAGGTPPPPPANVAPSVSITSPSSGASFSAGSSIAINANASDSDGTISKVEFFNGSVKLGEDLTSPYSYTMASAAEGSYSLVARATDNAGAVTNSATVSITVNAVPPPPTDMSAPVASITSPVNGAIVTSKTTVVIQASASDDIGVTKVEFYANGALKCTDTSAPYSCNWQAPKRSPKPVQLQVKAYDASGKVGNSAIVSVTLK